MSRQFWEELLAAATADGTAVANTAAETIIFPAIAIPANFLQDGRLLRIRAFGKLSTTATPTIQFGVRLGGVAGTLVMQSEAITNGSAVTNVNWSLEAYLQVRSNGASGTVLGMGEVKVHTAAATVVSNVFGVSGYDAPATATVDFTASKDLVVTAIWSAASASNTLTGLVYSVEALN